MIKLSQRGTRGEEEEEEGEKETKRLRSNRIERCATANSNEDVRVLQTSITPLFSYSPFLGFCIL